MKYFLTILFSLFLFIDAFSQYDYFQPKNSQLAGGLGLTWINGEPYYLFNFSPDIAIGKVGVGLDLNLRINKDGDIRSDEFKTFGNYLSIIKYVRYGLKYDPLYVKVGGLTHARLGQGNIISNYNNRLSYDNRKVGFEFDMEFENFGFESMYSDFASGGIFGIRGYAKPLAIGSTTKIPILSNMTIGATFASDFNEYSGLTKASFDNNKKIKKDADEGALTIIGLDMILPILDANIVGINLYSNFTKILKFGSGASAGIGFNFKGLGLLTANLQFERWFNGDQFIPKYFDQFYELERFNADTSKGIIMSKAMALSNAKSLGNSWVGEILIDILNNIQIYGFYSRYDDIPASGRLRLETDLSPKDASFVLKGYFDRTNIIDEGDIFKLDDRSILTAEIGYKPMTYILVSLLYQWTYAPERDKNNNLIGYKTQKRIEPRISLIFPFDLGNNPQKKK